MRYIKRLYDQTKNWVYCFGNVGPNWTVKEVHVFFSTIGFSHTADILLEIQLDGFSLLLMRQKEIIITSIAGMNNLSHFQATRVR